MSEHIVIENCEIWFTKLDPKRPNTKFDKKNPSWEIQIRTQSKEAKDRWIAQNLNPKKIIPEDEDENPLVDEIFWRVNLRRNSFNSQGEPSKCPEVVDGNLDEVDPRSIGNGSIGNVRVFQYAYEDGTGFGSVLMGLQLTKHIVYKPKDTAGFGHTQTEVITPPPEEEDDVPFDTGKKTPSPKIGVGSIDDEDADF